MLLGSYSENEAEPLAVATLPIQHTLPAGLSLKLTWHICICMHSRAFRFGRFLTRQRALEIGLYTANKRSELATKQAVYTSYTEARRSHILTPANQCYRGIDRREARRALRCYTQDLLIISTEDLLADHDENSTCDRVSLRGGRMDEV